MMLKLELRDDCLHSPMRLDLVQVEGVMLFPDDVELRSRMVRGGFVQDARTRIIEDAPSDFLVRIARAAVDAPDLPTMYRESDPRLWQGAIAGERLRWAIGLNKTQGNTTLADVDKLLCDQLSKHHQVEPKTILNRIWPTFKCVSHLWAAWRSVSSGEWPGEEAPPSSRFPCTTAGLAKFLGLANFYRLEGERTKAKKAPRSILLPGETITFDNVLNVPEVIVDFNCSKCSL